MDAIARLVRSARFYLLFVAAILLPQSVAAQATLSVVPTSVSVQTNVGTNAPSQTVQVRKSGPGALRWNVVPPAAAWVTVSPTSGTNNATLTLTFQTIGLAAQAQPYTTSFNVVSGTQSVTVNVAVTIVGSTRVTGPSVRREPVLRLFRHPTGPLWCEQYVRGQNPIRSTTVTNAVFGDPLFGTAKHCDVGLAAHADHHLPSQHHRRLAGRIASRRHLHRHHVWRVATGDAQCLTTSGSSFAVGTTTVQANARHRTARRRAAASP